jgi:hypothetical protein
MQSAARTWKWLGFLAIVACVAGGFVLLAQARQTQWPYPAVVGLRVLIVALALCGWFLSQSLLGSRKLDGASSADGVHQFTARLHAYLQARPKAVSALLIVSSAGIDLLGLALIAASVFGETMRPVLGLVIVFALRQVCQVVCALPPPAGMIWRYPGFPSLLVTYDVANDFFFSGHTSIAILGAIEATRLGSGELAVAAWGVALFEVATVLVLRAHYTLDVFTGIVTAVCVAQLAAWLTG